MPRALHRRTVPLALLAALLALLALAPGALADALSPESGGSENADDIDTLYWLTMAVAVIVFLGVEGTLFYCMYRFKAKRGAVPAQIRGNTRLEIGWTVGAAVILVFLAAFTFIQLADIRNPPDSDPEAQRVLFAQSGTSLAQSGTSPMPGTPSGKSLDIEVNGQQYLWRYTYPDGDRNPLNDVFAYEEMVVPMGITVTLAIRAQDVAHSWWIPELGGKFDAVPGHTNYTWFKVPMGDRQRSFRGQCAELCGRNHANMLARVTALPPREFEAWLDAKRQEIRQSNAAAARQRPQVERSQSEGDEEPAGREPDPNEETQ
jgi:cytochrome c oxidase subunit 2